MGVIGEWVMGLSVQKSGYANAIRGFYRRIAFEKVQTIKINKKWTP